MHSKAFFIILFFSLFSCLPAQNDSINPAHLKNRKIFLASGSGALTIGSLIALNQTWYSEYTTSKFHFFNDNKEWLQMDKVGHVCTNYQMSRLMMEAFDWAGFSRKQRLLIGGEIGLVYMTAIECMDGFSTGWGFSLGDEVANIAGTALAVSQEACWKDQKMQIKYSFSQSGLAKYNPSLLGEDIYSQLLKDYNGQTYWLSINPASFIKRKTKFPSWLNIALGYGAYGMLGGHSNQIVAEDSQGNILTINRERRFYLSLDVDLTKIKTKSKFLNCVFSALNILKFPAPAIQFSESGLKAYYLYY
jgi:hypothetical protein